MKAISPLLIQLSIDFLGSHSYAFWALSLNTIFGALMAVCLQTPQQDELKAIQEKLKQEEGCHVADAERVHNQLKQYSMTKNVALVLFALLAMFTSSVATGMLTFITIYCKTVLNIGIGRYLISTFNFSLLFYRLLTMATKPIHKLHSCLHSLRFMKIHLIVMSTAVPIGSILWINTPMHSQEKMLFILFGVTF